MASIIGSANAALSSTFDVVQITAETATQTVRTVARTMSMLDTKAEAFHKRIVASTKLANATMEQEEIVTAATAHVDKLEEAHRKNYPGTPFNRQATYEAVITKLEAALA